VSALAYEVVCDTDDEREWLAARNQGVGASEIGGVLGVPSISSRLSPLKLYCQKLGKLPPDDLSEVEAIDWGHTMEPVIAAKYAQRTGRPIVTGRQHRYQVLRSKEHPWALCSLDYWTADSDGAPLHPLEIKNVNAYLAEDWLDGTPEYFYAQLQQQMLVTDKERATSACCLGGNRLLWCDVERDETLIRKIIYHGERFWERVRTGQMPDPDESQATREVLHKLFAVDDGSSVELPAALLDNVAAWRAAKVQAKALETEITRHENAIKATLGSAQLGHFATGDVISWKTQNVREHVVKAGTKRPLLYHPSKD